MVVLRKMDVIHPELSYQIIGCAFDVFNEIGPGHTEEVYQKALSISFSDKNISFKEQIYYPVTFKEQVISRNFFDFLVEEKIIAEIKSKARFSKSHYDQTLKYLSASGLKLALLIAFGGEDVKCKRVVNFNTMHTHS